MKDTKVSLPHAFAGKDFPEYLGSDYVTEDDYPELAMRAARELGFVPEEYIGVGFLPEGVVGLMLIVKTEMGETYIYLTSGRIKLAGTNGYLWVDPMTLPEEDPDELSEE